jgi:hypothetical protein
MALTTAAKKEFLMSETTTPMVLVCWVRKDRVVPFGV